MKKLYLLLFSLLLPATALLHFSLTAIPDYSLVFIHLGKIVPTYLAHAVNQARLFNPACPLFIITDGNVLPLLKDLPNNITLINPASIPETDLHRQFKAKTTLDKNFREGFWLYASERFLVLHDFMEHYELKNVFHLENDTMLYVDLEKLLPIFTENYPSIGAVFDNDDRCIPCLVYLASSESSCAIASCFAKHAHQGINDMYVMGKLKKQIPSPIKTLPIIMPSYVEQHGLKSTSGLTTHSPETFINSIELFNSIFDAAALGQFLGGIDPRNDVSNPGFINESCLFNPSYLTFSWEVDDLGRRIPYATCDNETYRINTLHIHSKRLENFLSLS